MFLKEKLSEIANSVYNDREAKFGSENLRELERMIDQQFISINTDYKDLRDITGAMPVVITLLNKGAFKQFQEKKRAAGYDLAHLKPPHMCAPDSVLKDLLFSGQDS